MCVGAGALYSSYSSYVCVHLMYTHICLCVFVCSSVIMFCIGCGFTYSATTLSLELLPAVALALLSELVPVAITHIQGTHVGAVPKG